MSAIAAAVHAPHDAHVASFDHALDAPANGTFLPRPRAASTFATLAFLFACGSAPIAAALASASLMYMMSYSLTIGAWMLVTVFAVFGPLTLGAILLSHDRGEWG